MNIKKTHNKSLWNVPVLHSNQVCVLILQRVRKSE